MLAKMTVNFNVTADLPARSGHKGRFLDALGEPCRGNSDLADFPSARERRLLR